MSEERIKVVISVEYSVSAERHPHDSDFGSSFEELERYEIAKAKSDPFAYMETAMGNESEITVNGDSV